MQLDVNLGSVIARQQSFAAEKIGNAARDVSLQHLEREGGRSRSLPLSLND